MNIQRCMNELDGYGKQKCTKESITNIQRLNQYFGEGNGGIIIGDFLFLCSDPKLLYKYVLLI